jgi:hypothetical protein
MSARKIRKIRRGCQRRSANRAGLGVSELFTAPSGEARAILSVRDPRLKRYLLGFDIGTCPRLVDFHVHDLL